MIRSLGLAAALTLGLAVTAAAQTFRCESSEGHDSSCPADTSRGILLERQLGGGECVLGKTWGWDGRGVWVRRNCRGDFRVGVEGFEGGRTLRCDSDHNQLERCKADLRAGLYVESADPGCAQGVTWGWSAGSLWVKGRCSASFRVDVSPADGRFARCSSNGGRVTCAVDPRGGVVFERQLSTADCVYGESWGLEADGLWVDHGCSGEFRIDTLRTANLYGGDSLDLVCESLGGRREFCPVESTPKAEVLSRASVEPCERGRDWDVNGHGLWVDHGCRAAFRLSR
jgi:Protein of unknown function (DUF3011)